VLIDRREVESGEGLLAMLKIVPNSQEVQDCEERDETEDRPEYRQGDEDAATQRLTGCDWRREQAPRVSQRRR
jgi:hypothetical protein